MYCNIKSVLLWMLECKSTDPPIVKAGGIGGDHFIREAAGKLAEARVWRSLQYVYFKVRLDELHIGKGSRVCWCCIEVFVNAIASPFTKVRLYLQVTIRRQQVTIYHRQDLLPELY